MELKTGKLTLKQIESLYKGLDEISNMLFDPETMMDLGIVKADLKVILTEFDKTKKEIINKEYKEFGIDENTKNINQVLINKLEERINITLDKLYKKEYDVQYPILKRSDIVKWVEEDKKNTADRAFKPSVDFYSNMKDFILK